MQQWVGELLPVLLEMLGDASSPEKRGVALWALGQLVGSTGYVVKPYTQYPTLLDVLINFLKTEQQPLIRYNHSLNNLFFQEKYQSSSSVSSSGTQKFRCLHFVITVEWKRNQKSQIVHIWRHVATNCHFMMVWVPNCINFGRLHIKIEMHIFMLWYSPVLSDWVSCTPIKSKNITFDTLHHVF